jgi:2-(1,2-epoxy-1,2-dihydrophenyl)acetyl-CoA isomerase
VDGGASATLAARIGHTRAFEMAYLGERIGAAQALDWGLVNRVVPDAQFEDAVGALAARLAAGPPGSFASIKRTINRQLFTDFEAVLDLELDEQAQRLTSADFGEGVMAFMQKRAPNFTGA